MAIEFISDNKKNAWAIWKITEPEQELSSRILPADRIPGSITNYQKRLEYASARVLLKHLLERWSLPYNGLFKDVFGKPFFIEHNIELSLSHSYPYVAAIINRSKPVGIDLEQPKQKLLNIAPRILHASELEDAGNDVVKHCIYWSAKESLVKVHGKKDLAFSENLLIEPFSRENRGYLTGRIAANGISEAVPLYYEVYDSFVIVVTT